MTVFYLTPWGWMGEKSAKQWSVAIFKLEDLIKLLPDGTKPNHDNLSDACRKTDPVEVFYADSEESAARNASIAVAQKYNGCEYLPEDSLARLWVCVKNGARKQGKNSDLQDELLEREPDALLTYTTSDDGYFDVGAVGPTSVVLAFIKEKNLTGYVVDVEDEESANAVSALGCEPCLEEHGLTELYRSLTLEAAATAMHS